MPSPPLLSALGTQGPAHGRGRDWSLQDSRVGTKGTRTSVDLCLSYKEKDSFIREGDYATENMITSLIYKEQYIIQIFREKI